MHRAVFLCDAPAPLHSALADELVLAHALESSLLVTDYIAQKAAMDEAGASLHLVLLEPEADPAALIGLVGWLDYPERAGWLETNTLIVPRLWGSTTYDLIKQLQLTAATAAGRPLCATSERSNARSHAALTKRYGSPQRRDIENRRKGRIEHLWELPPPHEPPNWDPELIERCAKHLAGLRIE